MARLEIHILILALSLVLNAPPAFAARVTTEVDIAPPAEKKVVAMLLPKLEVSSVKIVAPDGGRVIRKGRRSNVILTLTNTGEGAASGLSVRLTPSGNHVSGNRGKWWKPWDWGAKNNKQVIIGQLTDTDKVTLGPGESQQVNFSIEVGNLFQGEGELPIEVELESDTPHTSNNATIKLEYTQDSETTPPSVETQPKAPKESGMMGTIGQTTSDVIKNMGNMFGVATAFVMGGNSIPEELRKLPLHKIASSTKRYAIVIGIENYRQKLPRADFAVNDAKLVSHYLINALGYPEENVITLLNENASRNDMEKYFGTWLRNNVERDGTVFIYYSGHGAPNPKSGEAYLVPFDGDPTFIADTGYPLKTLYNNLAKLPVKKVVVALDSCFSGAGGKSVLAKGSRPLVVTMDSAQLPAKNIVVLAASSANQISSTYEEKSHGLFTYFFMMGIKESLDKSTDSTIEIDQVYEYLKPNVERVSRKVYNNEQTPQLVVGDKNLKKMGLD